MAREKRYKRVPELFSLSISSHTKWGEIVDLFMANYPFYRKRLLENFFNRDEQAVLIDLELYKDFLLNFLQKHISIYKNLLEFLGVDKHKAVASVDDIQSTAVAIDFNDYWHESKFIEFRKIKNEVESTQLLSIVSAVQAICNYAEAVNKKDNALKSLCLVRLIGDMAQANFIPDAVQSYHSLSQNKPGRDPGFKGFLISIFRINFIRSDTNTFKKAWVYLSKNPSRFSINQEAYHLAVFGERLCYREDQPASIGSQSITKETVSKYFRQAKKSI